MKTILRQSLVGYGVARTGDKRRGLWAGVVFTMLLAFSVAMMPAQPAQAQTLRLTALGDSLTAGYGLPAGEGLVPQLQGWLSARGHDVAVLNAGVSGDTTTGGLARLDWTLADRPDAMIVALGGNDLLRGIDPAVSRANLAAILTRLAAEGIPALLVGLPAPANYGPEFQAQFAALFPDLAAEFGVALLPDLLAPLTATLGTGQPATALMQPDMIHPNAEGVARVVAQLGPAVEALLQSVAAGG